MKIDHILLGCADHSLGIEYAKATWGLHPFPGGRHPLWGTMNSLVSLGHLTYLEIISPTNAFSALPPFDKLNTMYAPVIFTWCCRTIDIDQVCHQLDNMDMAHSKVLPGSRTTPDGLTLTWKLLFLDETYSGILPFFIQWDELSLHPSLAHKNEMEYSLQLYHPEYKKINSLFEKLGIDLACTFNTTIEIKLDIVQD